MFNYKFNKISLKMNVKISKEKDNILNKIK